MITNRQELKEYLAADLRQAYVPKNALKRWLYTLHGNEQCNAYKYVRLMRYTEYHLNKHHWLLYHWYRFRLSRYGLKRSIRIALNTCGKGLNIIHLAGGGGYILTVFPSVKTALFNAA